MSPAWAGNLWAFLGSLGERVLLSILGTALLAGVVWLILRLVGRALPPAAHAWLWWLVAVKAILALAWGLPVERPARWAIGPPAAGAQRLATDVDRRLGGQNLDLVLPSPARPDLRPEVAEPPSLAPAALASLGAVWLIGGIASVAWSAGRIRAARALVRAAMPVEDRRLLATVAELAGRLGVRGTVRLRWAPAGSAPAVAGLLRPVLLVPEAAQSSQGGDAGLDRLDGDQIRMALAHELIHLRRRDLLWGLVPALAERLFFFHPAVRAAARGYAAAREAACDRAVVAELGTPREAYGRLLLQLGVQRGFDRGARHPAWSLSSASPTYRILKRRLDMLRDVQVVRRLSAGRAALIVLALAAAAVPLRFTAPATGAVRMAGIDGPGPLQYAFESSAGGSSRAVVEPKEPAESRVPRGTTFGYSGDDLMFALLRGDGDVTFSGDSLGLEAAKRFRRAGEDVLWFKLDQQSYLVRDRSALDRAEAMVTPQRILGSQQGALGADQGVFGTEQGQLGAQQGALGARQGELGARQGALAAQIAALAVAQASRGLAGEAASAEAEARMRQLDRELRMLSQEQAQLSDQQRVLSDQQVRLSARQTELAAQQALLGQHQVEAAAQLERAARQLFEELVAAGLAEEVQ